MIFHCHECGTEFWGARDEYECPACGEDCADQVDIVADAGGHDMSDLEERLLANRDADWDYRPNQ